MNNSICVLIPTKNRIKLLKRCLNSVFNQSVQPEEVVVVNDGSNDETIEFIESIKNKHNNLFIINRNFSGGVNTARHDGINFSKSDWIATLDDDDEFLDDAIKTIKSKLNKNSSDSSVLFFNSIIKRDNVDLKGGFQFKGEDFYDLNYDEMMTKFRIKGDCKPVFKIDIFKKYNYKFPLSVNGLESYLFYLLARDGFGIRCYPEITTIIHQESEVGDRLSISASAKNPWPLFVLHFKQIFQHFRFYISHPLFFLKKLKEMLKLFVRSVLKFFGF